MISSGSRLLLLAIMVAGTSLGMVFMGKSLDFLGWTI